MNITASNTIDLKTITAVHHLSLFKKHNPKKCFALAAAGFLLLLGIIVTECIMFKPDRDFYFFTAILILIAAVYAVLMFLTPRLQYRRYQKLGETKNEYSFGEEEFKVTSVNGQGMTGESVLQYSIVFKVMETDSFFFIYINKLHVYAVDKSTVANGTAHDLHKLLSSKIANYVVCNY